MDSSLVSGTPVGCFSFIAGNVAFRNDKAQRSSHNCELPTRSRFGMLQRTVRVNGVFHNPSVTSDLALAKCIATS